LTLSTEGVYRSQDLSSVHAGLEWRPVEVLALRAGYRSDLSRHLPGPSGLTMGVGLRLWRQEFDYAWVPVGDLGNVQYFSLLIRFSQPRSEEVHSL